MPRSRLHTAELPSHTKLKVRKIGQGSAEEIEVRDLKAELLRREQEHYEKIDLERRRQGLPPLLALKQGLNPEVSTEEKQGGVVDLSQFDDSDDRFSDEEQEVKSNGETMAENDEQEDEEQQEEEEEDDDEEEEELLRELEKIKREREEEKKRRREEEEMSIKAFNLNPLLEENVRVKRRWDEDVVFRNQARDDPDSGSSSSKKKRFLNDTVRNDFHVKFLKRYIH